MLKELFVAISAVLFVHSAPTIPMPESKCGYIVVQIELHSLEDLGRGEAWVDVMKMFVLEAKRYKLNETEINNINKELAEMNNLLDEKAKELGFKRPFLTDDASKEAFSKIVTRRFIGKILKAFRSIRKNTIVRWRRYKIRVNAEKLRSQQLKACRKNNACEHAPKPAPHSLEAKVLTPKNAAVTGGEGLSTGSSVALSVFERHPVAWGRTKKALGWVGSGVVTWGVFQGLEELIDFLKGDPDNEYNQQIAEMLQDVHEKVVQEGIKIDDSEVLEHEDGQSALERVIKGLRFDVNGFRDVGKEIIEDITMDFMALHDSKDKQFLSYSAIDEAVWNKLKTTPAITASWDPKMTGGMKAEYLRDTDAVEINIPRNCTLVPKADKLTSSLNETIPLEEGAAPASEHTEAAGSRSTLKITIGVVAGVLAIIVGVLIKFCAGGHCKRGVDHPEAVQTDVASQPQEEQEHSEAGASTSDVMDIEKD